MFALGYNEPSPVIEVWNTERLLLLAIILAFGENLLPYFFAQLCLDRRLGIAFDFSQCLADLMFDLACFLLVHFKIQPSHDIKRDPLIH